jgi:hypothetical protein
MPWYVRYANIGRRLWFIGWGILAPSALLTILVLWTSLSSAAAHPPAKHAAHPLAHAMPWTLILWLLIFDATGFLMKSLGNRLVRTGVTFGLDMANTRAVHGTWMNERTAERMTRAYHRSGGGIGRS